MPDFSPPWAVPELTFPGILAAGDQDAAGQKSVRRVQEWCSFHGHATGIDGDFGPATAQALKGFQSACNLPATGSLDSNTWNALVAPMQGCLSPNPAQPGEQLYDVVVRTAKRHLAAQPVEEGGDNCGPWVRLYMQGHDGVEWKWCAGFACFILLQSNAALGAAGCPIPYQVGVNDLVADAKRDGRFVAQQAPPSGKIRPGCLFVKRQGNDDWCHTGLVVSLASQSFQTIEGNTDTNGSSNGYEVASRTRAYSQTDFILLP